MKRKNIYSPLLSILLIGYLLVATLSMTVSIVVWLPLPRAILYFSMILFGMVSISIPDGINDETHKDAAFIAALGVSLLSFLMTVIAVL